MTTKSEEQAWFEEPLRIELTVEELLSDLDEGWSRWNWQVAAGAQR